MKAFSALSVAIAKGFFRDKTSVFFAVIFPLMFLVVFGGIFSERSASKVDVIKVGPVSLIDQMPDAAMKQFEKSFKITKSSNLGAALEKVRKGEADVAVEMKGNALIAHYSQADQVTAAMAQGALSSFVDSANLAASRSPATFEFKPVRVEDKSLKTIQFVTPGLLGWAVAMSAAFGAAATLNGWRNSKLLRRLQLAPVRTPTLVAARVAVTVGIALVQLAIFLGLGVALFGLQLTGAWVAAIPLLIVGTLCFMAIGLLAGAVAKTTEGAVNMANFIVLPMSFLSGSFFPLDGAPQWLQIVSKCLPLRWLNDGMLDVMVRGQAASAILVPMVVLAGFAVVVTLLAAKLFRWES